MQASAVLMSLEILITTIIITRLQTTITTKRKKFNNYIRKILQIFRASTLMDLVKCIKEIKVKVDMKEYRALKKKTHKLEVTKIRLVYRLLRIQSKL